MGAPKVLDLDHHHSIIQQHHLVLFISLILFLSSYCPCFAAKSNMININHTTTTTTKTSEDNDTSEALAKSNSFKRWISWHVQNYQRKKLSSSSSSSSSSSFIMDDDLKNSSSSINTNGGSVVEWGLRMAEMNRTEIRVRQDDDDDGSGDHFHTISQALRSIPLHNTRRVIIYINSGVYWEKVNIPRTMRFITMVGNASDPPIITGNDTASTTANGRTFQSATVAIDADYFVAINLIFQNTVPHVVGSVGGQAVAVRISGSKAAFYNCSFYGGQDTVYDHKGLHYFKDCFIQGSVDFIFGYGTSLYQNCYLKSVSKKVASVTAQKRSNSSLSSGFSFKDCIVTGNNNIYLGRAWGDYSRVVFSYTFMDAIVLPQGWNDWGKINRQRSVYYGEYKCSGPGANLTGRVGWARALTDEEAMPFIGTYFIDGDTWLIHPSSYTSST